MRILIIEDQENLAKLIQKGLVAEGFAVDYILDGQVGENRLQMHHQDYDLLILDLMLPNKNGLEICAGLRAQQVAMPILMLTAKDDVKDITAGLNAGADDYLTKPFSFEELLARVRALLRRPQTTLPLELKVKDICLNPVSKRVTKKGKEIQLTLKEFGLLEYLMRNAGQAVTRERILSGIWDFAFDSFANVVDVHVTNLRKKLGDKNNNLIETVRGVGYRINGK